MPFLRYLPERLGPAGARVAAALRERLGAAPSFVAFEGHDTIAVLAALLRAHGPDRARIAAGWPDVAVAGTRGPIRFSRVPGLGVWQWAWPPVQVAERDPADPAASASCAPANLSRQMLGVAKLAPGPGHIDLVERTPADCPAAPCASRSAPPGSAGRTCTSRRASTRASRP